MSTATAKMNLLNTLNKEQFKYSLLLYLEKAIDMVNRSKLIQDINITIKDQNNRKVLLLILEIYKYNSLRADPLPHLHKLTIYQNNRKTTFL